MKNRDEKHKKKSIDGKLDILFVCLTHEKITRKNYSNHQTNKKSKMELTKTVEKIIKYHRTKN